MVRVAQNIPFCSMKMIQPVGNRGVTPSLGATVVYIAAVGALVAAAWYFRKPTQDADAAWYFMDDDAARYFTEQLTEDDDDEDDDDE